MMSEVGLAEGFLLLRLNMDFRDVENEGEDRGRGEDGFSLRLR
jgi:hypothetical protein